MYVHSAHGCCAVTSVNGSARQHSRGLHPVVVTLQQHSRPAAQGRARVRAARAQPQLPQARQRRRQNLRNTHEAR